MVPVLRSDGSLANSSMERIGPQGMSCSLSNAMASNLVLVTVHASTVANTSLSLGRGASGVAKSGLVSQSSLPITLQMSFQTGACAMKYRYALGSVSQPLHLTMVPGCPPPDALAARGTAAPNLPFGYCGYSFITCVRSRRCWSRSLTRHRFKTPSCIAASTLWPRPLLLRWYSAQTMPSARCRPVPLSPICAPVTSGGPSSNPGVDAAPPAHCATFSYTLQSSYGPGPKPFTDARIMRGLSS